MRKRGFTLLELIIVISILGAIMAMASGNYMTSLKRGRDVKRKAEAASLKIALQLYNMDYAKYPNGSGSGTTPPYGMNGCGTNGTSTCPPATCTSVDFGAGNASCTGSIYMINLPASYGNATNQPMRYHSTANQANFCILQALEITTDPDIALSQSKCVTQCTGFAMGTNYVVCNE